MRWRVIPLAGCYLSPITTTLKKDFNRTPHDARRGRNSSVLIRSPVWLDRFSHKSDITSPQGTPAGHKSFIRSIRIYVRMYVYTYIYIHTYNKLFAINVSKYKCKCKFKIERRVCKAWFRVINKN